MCPINTVVVDSAASRNSGRWVAYSPVPGAAVTMAASGCWAAKVRMSAISREAKAAGMYVMCYGVTRS